MMMMIIMMMMVWIVATAATNPVVINKEVIVDRGLCNSKIASGHTLFILYTDFLSNIFILSY